MLGARLFQLLNQPLILLVEQTNIALKIIGFALHVAVQIVPLASLLVIACIVHKIAHLAQ